MDERSAGKLKVWTPLLFSLVLIFGMVLGFNLRDTLRNKRDIQAVIDRSDRLEQIIDLIREKYVDSVEVNLVYEDAVNGILSHLDPHTVYIPAENLQSVNEDLEGSFFGIGVEFAIPRDTIQVISIIEHGPAERAGVETGDQIIKVEDSLVAGTGITNERIIRMLRGKQNTKVHLTLRTPGGNQLKQVTIERDAIPLHSVEANLMLDSITGFIRINRFSATTFTEFHNALDSLKAKGARQLVLDLRQNPGGYLEAATMIADEFLDDEKLIVYTEGKQSPRKEYKAGKPGRFEQGRLVVLVDESSASASEVLAGAIQDWDRGIIIGRRTFGKGLVQEQFELGDGSALRLTVARYYTPSGRSIQRSFSKGKEVYAADLNKRLESGELTGKDSIALVDTMRFYTSGHRTVYSGGGITPDIYVPYDTGRLKLGLTGTVYNESLNDLILNYYIGHRSELKGYRNVSEYSTRFNTGDLINNYLLSIPDSSRKDTERILALPENRKYFELFVKSQLARHLFRNNGYYAIYNDGDQVVKKALQTLHGKAYSEIINR